METLETPVISYLFSGHHPASPPKEEGHPSDIEGKPLFILNL
jgi:hypothetical protein